MSLAPVLNLNKIGQWGLSHIYFQTNSLEKSTTKSINKINKTVVFHLSYLSNTKYVKGDLKPDMKEYIHIY